MPFANYYYYYQYVNAISNEFDSVVNITNYSPTYNLHDSRIHNVELKQSVAIECLRYSLCYMFH